MRTMNLGDLRRAVKGLARLPDSMPVIVIMRRKYVGGLAAAKYRMVDTPDTAALVLGDTEDCDEFVGKVDIEQAQRESAQR